MKRFLLFLVVSIGLLSLLAYVAIPGSRYDLGRALAFGASWGTLVGAALFVSLRLIRFFSKRGA